MEFEWDPKKAEANKRKHGVTFQEGTSIFGDPLAITFADPDHSEHEERSILSDYQVRNACLLSHIPTVRIGQGLSVRVL